MDILTYAMAKAGAKAYTDAAIAGMAKGFDYKGSKPTAADLPTSGNKKGDCWTTADTGAEYIWDGTQWIELGRSGAQYTAGENINITDNVISAVDTTYTAGNGIKITGTEIAIDNVSGIAIYETRIDDANKWLTNGYVKTSNDIPTANLPSVCTWADRWGVLLYVAENNENKSGLQQYFPIDGAYKGRIFYRSVTGGVPNPVFSEWQLVPWTAEVQGKLTAGTNITIEDNVISATGGSSVLFDEQTVVKGADDKYKTAVSGWKETIPEETTPLFVDTKGTGLPTFVGPGSTEQYEVGWDYNTTITSLVGSATTTIVNAKFTVLGTTFNSKITLTKQTSIPASWESGDIAIGGTNYKVKVYDQYTGENNGGISVISSDTGADLSESRMELFSLVTAEESSVYHKIDNNFISVDETSVILDTNEKIAVNPDLILNSLTAANNGIRLYKSTTGEQQPTLRLNGALVMNSSQLESNIAEKGVALGLNCTIQNQGAFASGVGTAARGTASHAVNKDTTAANQYSFASGLNTVAGANVSFVAGNSTVAKNANEAVFGILNEVDNGGVDPRLLAVGNGYEADKGLYSADELVGKYYDSGNKTADRYVLITDANKQSVKDNSSITKVQIRQNAFSVTKSGKVTATSLSDGTNEKTMTEVLNGALPTYTSLDEGRVLKIVNGVPTWVLEV